MQRGFRKKKMSKDTHCIKGMKTIIKSFKKHTLWVHEVCLYNENSKIMVENMIMQFINLSF